jgi:hypothetical protein
MNNFKLDIRILKILYAVIFVVAFILYFDYTNSKTATMEDTGYAYTIKSVSEETDEVNYEVTITTKYDDDTLFKICNEIKEDYINLYHINDVNEKVDNFNIKFYYDDKVYKEISNNKGED